MSMYTFKGINATYPLFGDRMSLHLGYSISLWTTLYHTRGEFVSLCVYCTIFIAGFHSWEYVKNRNNRPFVIHNSLPVQNTLTSLVSHCTYYDTSWRISCKYNSYCTSDAKCTINDIWSDCIWGISSVWYTLISV